MTSLISSHLFSKQEIVRPSMVLVHFLPKSFLSNFLEDHLHNLRRQLLVSDCVFYLRLITVSEQFLVRDASPPWLMVYSALWRDAGTLLEPAYYIFSALSLSRMYIRLYATEVW